MIDPETVAQLEADARTAVTHEVHLTDGQWHDACQLCLRRRIIGGTGWTFSPTIILALIESWKKRGDTIATVPKMQERMGKLVAENNRLREALEEICLGRGPFSLDPAIHAANTIEAMVKVARRALEKEEA